jgi:heptosyltransferase III
MHFILSRTDSIGDVILTLPMAGLIKEKYQESEITFIGRNYTEPVIKLSKHIDHFINWDEIENLSSYEQAESLKNLEADWIFHVFPNKKIAKAAKRAAIPFRIGTSHRTYHWFTCNKRLSFSRKNSELHEAQLNCKLLEPLSIGVPPFKEIYHFFGLSNSVTPSKKLYDLIDNKKHNIVLHPKSKGSAREWGLENFQELIDILPKEKYKVFITGNEEEGKVMRTFLEKNQDVVTDTTGKFGLTDFIAFLSIVDSVVAASTGPLHIASVLNKNAIGIYPPIRPMHPGRWAPIGKNSHVLVKPGNCNFCRKSGACICMKEIRATDVKNILDKT